jgi:preprotein translocase subunit SecG
MDFISSSKNAGSSAFGSSSTSGNGSSAAGGMFSNFFNLTIQKMVLILAIIAFIISIGTVAILLWKSKSTQKWPPEIARCPDRLEFDGTDCVDKYRLGYTLRAPSQTDNCANFDKVKAAAYTGTGLTGVETGYVSWEGIVDGQKSRASSLKCLI